MKNIFIVKAIMIAFLAGQVFALNAQLWEYFYDFYGGEDYPEQVMQTEDGGFLITGKALDSLHWFGFLLKTDDAGTEEWRTAWNDVQKTAAFSVVDALEGGGYTVAGLDQFSSGVSDASLRKFDLDGKLVWEKFYTTASIENCFEYITHTEDGNYVVCGYAGYLFHDVWLLKIDSLGNVLWEAQYSEDGSYIHGRVAKPTIDGGYIVYAQKTFPDDALFFIKTDAEGNEQWRRVMEVPGQFIGLSLRFKTSHFQCDKFINSFYIQASKNCCE